MPKTVPLTGSPGVWIIECPGCKNWHPLHVGTAHPDGSGWTFNGDVDRPTFTPSLLVYPSGSQPRCHSFITDGRIQFLSDCSHPLANQTVELPEIEDDLHL